MKAVYVLDETDNKILELLRQGFSPKQIAHKIWKSDSTVKMRLFRLRKRFECTTTIQLMASLNKESA